MISNREFGRRRWSISVWVAAVGASLMIASVPKAAFAQPAPVCSNQAQIDACVAQTCGTCATNAGSCGGAKGQCEVSCASTGASCLGDCVDLPFDDRPSCELACTSAYDGCLISCDSACGSCVAQCRGPCDNLCVVCNSGGPYAIACDAPAPHVIQLDGSGSSDPQGGELTYEWVPSCSGMTVDDDAIESPKLTLDPPLNCRTCFVTLYLTDEDGGQATCNDLVNVTDETPPEIGEPEAIDACYKFVAGAQSAACAALQAVATDNCDPSLTCQATSTTGPNESCEYSVTTSIVDECDNRSETVEFQTHVDGERPTATCAPVLLEYAVDENCEAIVKFTGQIKDNCCLGVSRSFPYEVRVVGGNATVASVTALGCAQTFSDDQRTIDVECTFRVSDLTSCPAVVELSFDGTDCCGNTLTERCVATTNVVDEIKPTITCPPSITLDRGDKICNDDVKNWLESATATDNCDGEPTITTDAPECGFPYGSTTEVTFTAEDGCGNTSNCTSTITIEPTPRVSGTQKGSLLVFSDVELRWDPNGVLTQDTFLAVANDADLGSVNVQAWFINGDIQIEQIVDESGELIQEFEPGWNTADCRFELTKNQPHYWSAARGSNKCQPFIVLDEDGPGRIDRSAVVAAGPRVLRGYVVMVAVSQPAMMVAGVLDHPNAWQEIRWNHLYGSGAVLNYANGGGHEYNAWAYQARCGETGEPLLDCQTVDVNGTCCTAEVVPGRLDMDGFQYDINFDELLLGFYASGSTALSNTNTTVMVDTALTLHTMDIDVRQDGDGPILTKAEFEIYNEFESKFSGTRKCICCWDQSLLSNYVRDESIPNHFLRTQLHTDTGSARIDGVHSRECDYFDTCGIWPRVTDSGTGTVVAGGNPDFSRDTALLGVAVKQLTFTGPRSNFETAGMNLVGSGEQQSRFRFDVDFASGELRAPTPTVPASRRPLSATKLGTSRGNTDGR